MNILSFIIYIPLQIVFIPFAIIGALLVAYKQIVVSKRLGSSQTAIEVINGRWTMHIFGLRTDYATAKIAEIITARTAYFDRIIERASNECEQMVVLGAGYDMRAYGPLKNKDITFFELDQLDTQTVKKNWLSKAAINSDHVHFVPVDFNKDNVFSVLKQHGYHSNKKTLFLWEGVTLYLQESAISAMLSGIRQHAATGSVIAADFYAERFARIAIGKSSKAILDYTQEGLQFSLPFQKNYKQVLQQFITSEDLSLGEQYFIGSNDKNGPFMVVSEIKVGR